MKEFKDNAEHVFFKSFYHRLEHVYVAVIYSRILMYINVAYIFVKDGYKNINLECILYWLKTSY